jgi:hypothetical protein
MPYSLLDLRSMGLTNIGINCSKQQTITSEVRELIDKAKQEKERMAIVKGVPLFAI